MPTSAHTWVGFGFGRQQPIKVRHRLADRPTLPPGVARKRGGHTGEEDDGPQTRHRPARRAGERVKWQVERARSSSDCELRNRNDATPRQWGGD